MGLLWLILLSVLSSSFQGAPCLGNSEGESGSEYRDGATLYDIRAYPTYYGALDGEESTMDQNPYGFIMQRVDKVVGITSSSNDANVDDYGAKGDGSDDTEAFENAWSDVCSSPSSSVLTVPANKKYLLKPITFSGPCNSNVSVMVEGTLQASSDVSDWDGKNHRYWILFHGVNNLHVGGGGTVDGNGEAWWKHSCKVDKSKPCKDAPTAITFYGCQDLTVDNLMVKDGQQIQVQFQKCTNVRATNLNISAPEKSPNTDGIHVTRTQNIHIDHCNIGTGDDCISIVSGSQSVTATNIVCGPGHGISIGSLGAHHSEAYVSDVVVDTVQLNGTTNGVRIKTWQGGSGYAKHILFQNIGMNNVKNPIIIDQNYCDKKKSCHPQKSAVEVSDVVYKNIQGTSASEVAIRIECSKTVPCKGIMLQDIDLVREDDRAAESLCENLEWTRKGTVIPPCDSRMDNMM